MDTNKALNQLLDMGCNPVLCQAAIKNLKTDDLSALLDWISEHSEEEEKWSKWLSQNKEEGSAEKKEEAGQSISHLVKKQFVEELMSKGHSKNVSEKSLLLTGNTSVVSAQAWIQQHRYDPDFEQELFLQGQAYQESTLTDEEAKQKAKELTEKARQKRRKMEEEEEREREKNRVRYGKEMIEAKRIAEEQAMKRQLQLDKIQKRKDEEYKQKLIQQMRRQKNEKLGIKDDGTGKIVSQKKVEQPKLNMLQQLQLQCEQVKVGMHAYPEKARTFFETAQIYINNIIKNNGEQKFRKINLQNKAFKSRIAQCFGGVQTLQVLGYEEENGFLVMNNFDLATLGKVTSILERYKNYY